MRDNDDFSVGAAGDAIRVIGTSANRRVDVEVLGGRVTRMAVDREWRTTAPEHEVRRAIIEAVNAALARSDAEFERTLDNMPFRTGAGADVRWLAADLEALDR